MLRLERVHAGYGDLEVLHGVTLDVSEGEVVSVIGANGAGKTTTLRTVSGLLSARAGRILFDDREINTWPPSRIVAAGLVQVAEGRRLFPALTVDENLRIGAYKRGRSQRAETAAEVFELFPRLEERRRQRAGTLSGGEQQMLAIGRALMARPRLLMLDEPSQGLAPLLVTAMFEAIERIRSTGVTVLLVEQNAAHALEMADRGFVLESGEVALEGPGADLLGDDRVRSAYLGL